MSKQSQLIINYLNHSVQSLIHESLAAKDLKDLKSVKYSLDQACNTEGRVKTKAQAKLEELHECGSCSNSQMQYIYPETGHTA